MPVSTRRRQKDEQGAYAVLFAVLVLVMGSIAALAVDIGNAVARKSDVQGQADFAALGAAAQLTANTGASVPSDVLDEVRLLLNENRARNWGSDCSTGPTCITSNSQLTNLVLTDGEVRFANGGLQVLTPYEQVDFGLAKMMGYDKIDVQGSATVRIASPLGAVPMYAVSGCDSGSQTLTDPAGGSATPPAVPTLYADAETNGTKLDPALSPDNSVDYQAATPPTITITGQAFDDTRRVGFFRGEDATAPPVETNVFTPNPINGNGSFSVEVPSAVTSVEEVWYIRVWNGPLATPATTASKWSDRAEAIPLRVGSAFLNCGSGSNEGNFGVLNLPRDDVSSQDDQIAKNIATTLHAPLSLATHPGYNSLTGTCVDGADGAVTSDSPTDRNAGTNCVTTKPGLPANAATKGLVTGVSGVPGRLDKPTTPGCAQGGGDGMRLVDFQGGSNDRYINNDVLSCFLKDGTTALENLTTQPEGAGPLLHSDIYKSPRLIFVPVLAKDPSTGTSNNWSIIDFRPGFITDEPANTVKGQHLGTHENGVVINQNDVIQVKVFFFSIHALPPPPAGGAVTDYLGVGPKLVQLID